MVGLAVVDRPILFRHVVRPPKHPPDALTTRRGANVEIIRRDDGLR